MSLDAMRWAFQQTGLRSPVKFVLVALADRANERDECWPSREGICADTGLNKQTVSKATEELVSLGLIEKRRTYSGSTVYHLVGVPSRHHLAEIPAKLKSRTSVSRKTVRQSAEISAPNLPINLPMNRKKPEKGYAFTGETVRITTDDFARLAIQYPNLDLATELPQLDLELRGKRSWWNPLNAKLNYRNKNHGSDRPGRSASTDGSAAGRVRAEVERARAARAAAGSGGNALATDGLDVRNPLDGEFRRCG
jgi:hypothetical protein